MPTSQTLMHVYCHTYLPAYTSTWRVVTWVSITALKTSKFPIIAAQFDQNSREVIWRSCQYNHWKHQYRYRIRYKCIGKQRKISAFTLPCTFLICSVAANCSRRSCSYTRVMIAVIIAVLFSLLPFFSKVAGKQNTAYFWGARAADWEDE